MVDTKWFFSVYEGPKNSPGFRFWQSFLNWQHQLNILLKTLDMTQPQFAILAICGWLNDKCKIFNQQDISKLTNMDRMHISQIISRLEMKGFIEKKVNPQDLRTNLISITDTGQQQLSLAIPIVEKFDKEFFDQFSI